MLFRSIRVYENIVQQVEFQLENQLFKWENKDYQNDAKMLSE